MFIPTKQEKAKMNKVTYNRRNNITDVMVNDKYVGCVIRGEDGKYRTIHKNESIENKEFTAEHFALYHVEKGM